jgi:hypothetical protein
LSWCPEFDFGFEERGTRKRKKEIKKSKSKKIKVSHAQTSGVVPLVILALFIALFVMDDYH